MVDVSVIIPAYNRLWCLPRAVESCRHSVCNTEIIVVDDGSTDGTWEWLGTQSDIIAVKQPNMGQTYAVNKGFQFATGRYIRFLDSDDFLAVGIVDKQYNIACETGADLVCARVDFYEEATGIITVNPEIKHWEDFLEVQLGHQYGSHFLGMLFHRTLVENVPRRPEFAFREDRFFLLEVGLMEPKFVVSEGCGGFWVQHSAQMQSNYKGLTSQVTNWQHLQIYRKILGVLDSTSRLTPARRRASCEILWLLANWVAQNHLKEAEDVYLWIKNLCPEFQPELSGWKLHLYTFGGFRLMQKTLRVMRILKYGWK